MNEPFDAIYEDGVLKPVEPLHLPDRERVSVMLVAAPEAATTEEEVAASQKAALKALWKVLDSKPQFNNNDGWSAANHDDLLYGPWQ